MKIIDEICFEKLNGLIPAIAQDADSGKILMVGFMNRESFEKTVREGKACYFSRSRNTLWTKGESSGNVQNVKEIFLDCDLDTVVLKVEQVGGAACHEGYPSCFYRKLTDDKLEVVEERAFDPKTVYK
jgi:phosphoribosyl-AMP cyclohydrolase